MIWNNRIKVQNTFISLKITSLENIFKKWQFERETTLKVSTDFHNSNLFSEHLKTHCTLELWGYRLFIRSTRILMADSEKTTTCWNFIWVKSKLPLFVKTYWSLNYICFKQSNKCLLLTMDWIMSENDVLSNKVNSDY